MERRTSSVTNTFKKESVTNETEVDAEDIQKKETRGIMKFACMNSMKVLVLCVLCLQNSMFTILRRYSQGVLKEVYSKHEVLLVGEVIKMVFSAWMITGTLPEGDTIVSRITYLIKKSRKMFVLAAIYGAMNILSYVSLRNIGAGIFTIFAQCKILTTATFSSIILKHKYSWAQWRAMVSLMLGVLLFTAPVWNNLNVQDGGNAFVGTAAVLIEVTLSGFASIYFEKVIKTDPEQIGIWERNFQLALGSCPIYIMFIISNRGDEAGFLGGWTPTAWILAFLGSAGGLLVALSIKYGDSILKTLATTGAIILSSVLDYAFLGGPLTPVMCIAGTQVIIAIANYTFDYPPPAPEPSSPSKELNAKRHDVDNDNEMVPLVTTSSLTGRILNSPGSAV